MYHQILEEYLIHYQPALRAELMEKNQLASYLNQQNEMMAQYREQLLRQSQAREPQLSQLQRVLEADQQVREVFLPL